MLLVEFTINSVLNHMSVEGHGLVNNWKPRVLDFDAPTLSIPSDHGGYMAMTFGNIVFNPLLFAGDWPPPVSCPIAIYYTDTTEAARELVFEGTAHLSEFDREAVTYALYYPTYDETIAAATAYNNTLNSVMTAILTSIAEIDHVDTAHARASSPNVTHTTIDETLAIDLASSIAEFYGHLLYIVGDTAYLVDMLLNNGTRTLTEYEFFSFPSYAYKPPVASVTCGQVRRFSAYPYGEDMTVTAYHTTEANIIVACDDILTIENSPRIKLEVPMIAGNFPAPGEKIIIPDTAHVADLASWIRVRTLSYDFIGNSVTIEGEGAIAAA